MPANNKYIAGLARFYKYPRVLHARKNKPAFRRVCHS